MFWSWFVSVWVVEVCVCDTVCVTLCLCVPCFPGRGAAFVERFNFFKKTNTAPRKPAPVSRAVQLADTHSNDVRGAVILCILERGRASLLWIYHRFCVVLCCDACPGKLLSRYCRLVGWRWSPWRRWRGMDLPSPQNPRIYSPAPAR